MNMLKTNQNRTKIKKEKTEKTTNKYIQKIYSINDGHIIYKLQYVDKTQKLLINFKMQV